MKRILFATAAAAAVVGFAAAGPVQAFPDKDITWIIPFSPGGGMDSTSRAIAAVLPKYLSKNVNVVPKNVPGAGGRKGYAVLQRARGDGYTIGTYNMPGGAIAPLVGRKVNYDLDKVVWISRMSSSPYLFGVGAKTTIKSFDDLRRRSFKVGSTGFGSTAYAAMAVFGAVAKLDFKFVTGYKGSKAYIVAAVRGDVEGGIAPTQTFAKFVVSGDIRPIVTFERKSSFPGVKTIADIGYGELSGLGVQRLIGAPPGTPAAIQKILSDAVAKAIRDPQVQAWAKKTRRPFAYLPADEVAADYKKTVAFFLKYKSALMKK
jgi:putative tricarboxylic transport membrane protein